MNRRHLLGLGLSIMPIASAKNLLALQDFLPLLQGQLLPTVNRAYRSANLKSRAVFMGTPQLITETIIRVRMLERWPYYYQDSPNNPLQMHLITRELAFDPANSRWFLVNTSFYVQAIPIGAEKLGPTPRQYLDAEAAISDQTVGLPKLDSVESPFSQAVRDLLRDWQKV